MLVVLDNSTTAMTGHQPHPGTGKTMMGEISQKVDIAAILEAVGVKCIRKANPLHLEEAKEAIREAAAFRGVSAVIFESPCIAVTKPAQILRVDTEKCTGCKRCIRELGCPAMSVKDGKALIDPSTCYGCTICAQVCPFDAIGGVQE